MIYKSSFFFRPFLCMHSVSLSHFLLDTEGRWMDGWMDGWMDRSNLVCSNMFDYTIVFSPFFSFAMVVS
jgi:hypothetical protein